MKITRYIYLPFFLFILFIVLAISSEKYVLSGGIRQQDIKRFTHNFHNKEKAIAKIMEDTSIKLDSVNTQSKADVFEALKNNNELFEHKELAIMVTQNNQLIYWSDHVVGFSDDISSVEPGFVRLPNGWFILKRLKKDNLIINGLILIKYDYKIENQYLQNTFAQGFHLPDDFKVYFYESEGSYPIYDLQNRFLFSISPSGIFPFIYNDLYIPVVLYLISLMLLFVSLYRFNTHFYHRYARSKLIALLILLIGIYSIMSILNLPRSIYLLQLFSPKQFAYSAIWSSLGEFLIFNLLLFYFGFNFSRIFQIHNHQINKKRTEIIRLSILLLFLALFFVFIRFMLYLLVNNSSISFAIYRIEDIGIYSLIGFLSIGFLYFTFFLMAYRITWLFRKTTAQKTFILLSTIVALLVYLLFYTLSPNGNFWSCLFFWMITNLSFLINKRNSLNHRLTLIVLFVFIFTLFTLFNLIPFVEEHENDIQELMAINLSEEHDPSAEMFLSDIDYQLKKDTFLIDHLYPPYNFVEEYITNRYFSGYLREYDLQFTFCQATDSVMIRPENLLEPCYPFFDQMLERDGALMSGINFYFLANMNGRITYFGKFRFFPDQQPPVTLYIELNSKLLSEGTGFPELLLPEHSFENRIKNNFSFAKYNKGELVDRGGDFLYALTSKAYQLPKDELSHHTWDAYEHCIYALGNNNYIIVSRPDVRLYNYLIAFPYIFVFLFLLSLGVGFISHPYLKLAPIGGSLRMRIQASIIGVVFITLLIVGGGTIYYNIAQYRANHQQDLIDKINSVSVEIDLLMNDVDSLNRSLIEYLKFDLVRISDIFWTDVNIYDLNGHLVVSSRPDVFSKGLISEQMDNTAIYKLNKFQPTRFLHKEHIAKMEYLSAYVPLINRSGQNIGYINLPYFTKEREFRQEITTFILAFINIYVFLLLASILVAYFISIRITDPLKWIRENLRGMQLGKDTKPIAYQSDDEIGMLVAEYNNKVAELAKSADLLARSERETAWREMAKQIAHEIKNPLTPMKLNIQFLQRTNPSDDDYNEKVKKVTETLIEQIDNLSAIATEFSNFAKIPRAQNEEFLLALRLYETLKLYNYTGQVDIFTAFEGCEKMLVFADKEQFSRAIINLIKNAIQAIPEERKGKINISLKRENGSALVIVTDNGKGIPENLNESIFVPNFTTKSSGAGLGLAITKNIVENFKGEIWFKSTVNVGTTFYIRIPLIKQ